MANGQGRFGTRLRAIGIDALVALYGPARDIGRLIVRFLRRFCPDQRTGLSTSAPTLYMLPALWYTSDMRKEQLTCSTLLEDIQDLEGSGACSGFATSFPVALLSTAAIIGGSSEKKLA